MDSGGVMEKEEFAPIPAMTKFAANTDLHAPESTFFASEESFWGPPYRPPFTLLKFWRTLRRLDWKFFFSKKSVFPRLYFSFFFLCVYFLFTRSFRPMSSAKILSIPTYRKTNCSINDCLILPVWKRLNLPQFMCSRKQDKIILI